MTQIFHSLQKRNEQGQTTSGAQTDAAKVTTMMS